jgi:uncharacterized protein
MTSPAPLLREIRLAAGLSQRALARRARTSQPAIARYESGASTPSWETLQRIGRACGRRLTIESGIEPDPHDVELAEALLGSSPSERLRALSRYAKLRSQAEPDR